MRLFFVWKIFQNRSIWGTFDPLFSDYGYLSLESEIADFTVRKTGLYIPFWLADNRFRYAGGLGKRDGKRRAVLGKVVFIRRSNEK